MDIWYHIALYSDIEDLPSIFRLSKTTSAIAKRDCFWSDYLYYYFDATGDLDKVKEYNKVRIKLLRYNDLISLKLIQVIVEKDIYDYTMSFLDHLFSTPKPFIYLTTTLVGMMEKAMRTATTEVPPFTSYLEAKPFAFNDVAQVYNIFMKEVDKWKYFFTPEGRKFVYGSNEDLLSMQLYFNKYISDLNVVQFVTDVLNAQAIQHFNKHGTFQGWLKMK